MADLLASWTTTSEATETTLVSDIAVTIEADVLTGLKNGFADATDGSWAVPASWILDEALNGTAFWHRLLIHPITSDVLAHEYVGRFAPELLAKAIQFRDGVCRAPGCRVPAERCDLDHREPWPSGATNASNIWALCRRHHTLKGHQVLQWVLPDGRTAPAGSTEHLPRPPDPSKAEHLLATTVVDYVP
ncbi:HNH endonuclease signature motif containing protein [Aeromicrobium sp. CF4.19]|uniref:HNH endonuclease signature motif containing protein n=1 Tax=Aeromicrobium sp. CF4.19 TaxID=3373082 RepID=UPI003EE5B2BB